MLRILPLTLLLLCSCKNYPDSYPPPAQRHPEPAGELDPESMLVVMTDPDAPVHFVKDIDPETAPTNGWRWAGPEATLKILAVTTKNLKLKVDFTLWDEAFQQTGPVELGFRVNQKQLDKVRYTTPGYKHFEKPIPEDWMNTEVESTIVLTIDKQFVGKDGKKFGFILSSVGFVE